MSEKEPRITRAVLVEKDGKFLLAERNKENYKGYWIIPGGGVQFGETIQDAAVREIKEETNLDAVIEKKGILIEKTDHKLNKNWVILPFICRVKETKVTLDHENVDFKWITKGEMGRLEFVPGVIEDLKSVGLL